MISRLRFRWNLRAFDKDRNSRNKISPRRLPPRPQLNASLTIQQKLLGDNSTTELLRNQKSRKVKSRSGRSFTRRRGYSEARASHFPATSSGSFAMTALRQKHVQHSGVSLQTGGGRSVRSTASTRPYGTVTIIRWVRCNSPS